MELILAQLGMLFFGLFAYAAWKQHHDESTDSGAVVVLGLLLFLELPMLLGWGGVEFVYRQPELRRFRHRCHGAHC